MSRPKFTYIRSPALMALYRTIPCQHCGRDDGAVVGAHSNQAIHGKGRAIKATDTRCASLCARCHTAVDQSHHLSRDEREKLWWDAHVKTIREIVRRLQWPKEIPIPDLAD
jgi:hypothetical protein